MNTRSSSSKAAKAPSPRKLDVAVLARDGARLEGEWAAADLERLADSAAPETPVAEWPAVSWAAQGELRTPKGGEAQVWMHLQARARVSLSCQRCLRPVQEDLEVSRWFHFVRDEALAAELDADSEDEVLALTRTLDLQELVEDELLLALPLVPRHEQCPEALPSSAGELEAAAEEVQKPNPFAVLAALKKK
jgi:uncharacterized protein